MDTTAQQSGTGEQANASSGRVRARHSGVPITYANIVEVRAGSDEVVLTFGYGQAIRVRSTGENGEVANELMVDQSQRIALSPRAAKRLAVSLGQTLRQLEAQLGEIELNPSWATVPDTKSHDSAVPDAAPASLER